MRRLLVASGDISIGDADQIEAFLRTHPRKALDEYGLP